MERYHKEIYIPITIKSQLKAFNDRLNTLNWAYTSHSIDNIKNRCYDIKSILYFISKVVLSDKDIFEVYTDDNSITKVCYRIEYDTCDIILVISNNKTIITIFQNDKEDNHITLNKNIYARVDFLCYMGYI